MKQEPTPPIWAIADLHLPGRSGRTMDRFGPHWVDHPARIERAWRETVGPDDIVCIAGDISWATRPAQVEDDLCFIDRLPGALKILCRGNHDSWWTGPSRVRALLPPSLRILHNEAAIFPECPGIVFAGLRGWVAPEDPFHREERDARVWRRELVRLERVLGEAERLAGGRLPIVLLLHYPPVAGDGRETEMTRMLDRSRIAVCIYGHIHTPAEWRSARVGVYGGTRYYLTSADYLGFRPVRIEIPRPPVEPGEGG